MKRLDTDTVTIDGLTELVPVDPAADFLLIWDASVGATRKAKPNSLGIGGGAGGIARITDAPSANQDNYNPTGWATANLLDLTPTTDIVISGFAATSAGDFKVVRNTSTDKLIIIEDENTASTATNRCNLRNPVFIIPGASVTIRYDGARWRGEAASGGIGFGAFFDIFEDFGGSTGAFGSVVSGTGASAQAGTYLQNTTEKPAGVWQIDTGTTATGRAHLGFVNNAALGAGYGPAMFLTRAAVEALSNGTDRYQIFSGFHDAVGNTNVNDGVYWCYRDDVSAAWRAGVAAAGTRVENFAAGPTVNTNYIWLGIMMDPTWARAVFFYSENSVDWTIAGARTTGLPSGTQYFGLGNTINKTVGTAQRNLSVDLMAYRYDATRG